MTEPQRISARLQEMRDRHGIVDDGTDVDHDITIAAQEATRASVLAELWARSCPARFRRAVVDELDDGVRPHIERWLTTRDVNIVLLGPVGSGKSHALWATIGRMHRESVRWSGGSVPTILDSLRPDRERTFDAAADVLLLDDIGTEKPTEWTAEQLTRIIDSAWSDCRPVLASSNLAPKDLADWLGPRAWSRLAGGALVLSVSGHDRRFDR